MRGEDRRAVGLFSYVDLEARVPADHPLRPIRAMVDDALSALSGEFAALYSHLGRPSIAPERLLQAFSSVRSERLLMEQLLALCRLRLNVHSRGEGFQDDLLVEPVRLEG